MAYYQIVEKPFLFPQATVFTGNPSEQRVIDTGCNDETGGRIYVGLDELEDMARIVGYVTPSEVEAIRAENVSLKAQIDRIPETIERTVHDLRTALDRAIGSLVTDPSDSGDPVDGVDEEVTDGTGGPAPRKPAPARRQGLPRI